MKTKTLGIWSIALVVAGAMGAQAFANDENIENDQDSIRLRFEGQATIEQRWTKVPAIACSPEMRRTGRCPRPQPYYALVIKLETPKRGIDTVEAGMTAIGTLRRPNVMSLGDLEVREGDVVGVVARVRKLFNTGYVLRVYRARYIGHLPDEGSQLGAGYQCFLRDRIDVTYNQMSVFIVELRANRFDGTANGRLVADSSMRRPTKNILDLDVVMKNLNDRRRVGSISKRVYDRNGIVDLELNGALVPGAKLQVTGEMNLHGRKLELVGQCEYKSNIIRRRSL